MSQAGDMSAAELMGKSRPKKPRNPMTRVNSTAEVPIKEEQHSEQEHELPLTQEMKTTTTDTPSPLPADKPKFRSKAAVKAWTKHRRRVSSKHVGLPWRARLVRAQLTYKPSKTRTMRRLFKYAYEYLHSTPKDAPVNEKAMVDSFTDMLLDYVNAGEAQGLVDMKTANDITSDEDAVASGEPETDDNQE